MGKARTAAARLATIGSVAAALVALLSLPALAHEGQVIRLGSFLAGLTHPVLGLDHLLAMLAVGIVSAQIGGKAIWTVPATFVGVMALGGLIGTADLGLGASVIENGIAASVILLGIVIAVERNLAIGVAMVIVGVFAMFHGYAHGAEIPTVARPLLYAFGFLTGTALIHLTGVVIGDISKRYRTGRMVLRLGGLVIATLGFGFVVGVL
ncbi:MAG: HupE/UreJ family protein [Acidimicrobiia bacterium]|nr:HupE/UreJ family protein [Acidimicrobiia bacterium]